ncbi:protoheme IX farnesyltransferase, mitochondrial-like isoform X2 [Phragmites australis]|uniref:protoheme IX farnesyltransferase, mitochondrial-like isoform X2 n=1 Tax=Phragmites australis TaxID=29695 RepID=UPI002D77040D|nr:protoheme IX farnesyltransferase, mitochondrial-like isoform X2 [Phragmites australis]
MWRGGSTAASAARALRSRLLPDPIHYTATSLAPIASARAASSAPSAAAANTVVEEAAAAAAAVSVSHQAGSVSDALRYYGRCYWELSKARLSALVVATSGAGYVLGSGNIVDIAGLCCTCTGTMMVAASANTLNQVFEVKNDAKMKRTMRRPLPSGRISPAHAAMWATSVGAAGTALLAWKQIHPVNTWVGAVVGAIPPLLGWVAASTELSLNAMILPAALYYWQIPHFMALAYLCRNDYLAGGYRMFSFADPTGKRTAWLSLRNCLYMLPLGLLAYNWGLTSEWFSLEASLLTLGLTIGALSFVLEPSPKTARRMFYGSLLYLPAFMAGLLLHRLPNEEKTHRLAEKSELDGVLYGVDLQDEERAIQKGEDRKPCRVQSRPPVAYASVAPFPFLPVPIYVPSQAHEL